MYKIGEEEKDYAQVVRFAKQLNKDIIFQALLFSKLMEMQTMFQKVN